MLFRGDPGVPEDGVLGDYNNFGGRFGFAWDVFGDGKTSVRGGAGMFYDQHLLGEFNNGGVNAPPWSIRLSVTPPARAVLRSVSGPKRFQPRHAGLHRLVRRGVPASRAADDL